MFSRRNKSKSAGTSPKNSRSVSLDKTMLPDPDPVRRAAGADGAAGGATAVQVPSEPLGQLLVRTDFQPHRVETEGGPLDAHVLLHKPAEGDTASRLYVMHQGERVTQEPQDVPGLVGAVGLQPDHPGRQPDPSVRDPSVRPPVRDPSVRPKEAKSEQAGRPKTKQREPQYEYLQVLPSPVQAQQTEQQQAQQVEQIAAQQQQLQEARQEDHKFMSQLNQGILQLNNELTALASQLSNLKSGRSTGSHSKTSSATTTRSVTAQPSRTGSPERPDPQLQHLRDLLAQSLPPPPPPGSAAIQFQPERTAVKKKFKIFSDCLKTSVLKALPSLPEKDILPNFLPWLKNFKVDATLNEIPVEFQVELAVYLLPPSLKMVARAREPPIRSYRDLSKFFCSQYLGSANSELLLESFVKENRKVPDEVSNSETGVATIDPVSKVRNLILSYQAPLLSEIDPTLDTATASPQALAVLQAKYSRDIARKCLSGSQLATACLFSQTGTADQLLLSLNAQKSAALLRKSAPGKNNEPVGAILPAPSSCRLHPNSTHNTEDCNEIKRLAQGRRDRRGAGPGPVQGQGQQGQQETQQGGGGGGAPTTAPPGRAPTAGPPGRDRVFRPYDETKYCSHHQSPGHDTEECIAKRRSESAPQSLRRRTDMLVCQNGETVYCQYCVAHRPSLPNRLGCGHCWRHSTVKEEQPIRNCSKCIYQQRVDHRDAAAEGPAAQTTNTAGGDSTQTSG